MMELYKSILVNIEISKDLVYIQKHGETKTIVSKRRLELIIFLFKYFRYILLLRVIRLIQEKSNI